MVSLVGQLMIDGLAMGLVFVILATGLVLIMRTSQILFMAYGMLYMIGAYIVWFSMDIFALPYFAALIVGVLVTGMLGILSYLAIFRRLQNNEIGSVEPSTLNDVSRTGMLVTIIHRNITIISNREMLIIQNCFFLMMPFHQ